MGLNFFLPSHHGCNRIFDRTLCTANQKCWKVFRIYFCHDPGVLFKSCRTYSRTHCASTTVASTLDNFFWQGKFQYPRLTSWFNPSSIHFFQKCWFDKGGSVEEWLYKRLHSTAIWISFFCHSLFTF